MTSGLMTFTFQLNFVALTNDFSFVVKNLNGVPVINGYNIDKLIDVYSKVSI